jgi:hypothetical protein
MLAARQELKVSPDRVKQLGPGECFVIVGGCAQQVRVSQVRIAQQSDDAVPAQGMPAQPAIQGIGDEQRRAYRLAVAASALLGTVADQVPPAATDADILTIGNIPAPPLTTRVPPAPSTGQCAHGQSESEGTDGGASIEVSRPGNADDTLEFGDQA